MQSIFFLHVVCSCTVLLVINGAAFSLASQPSALQFLSLALLKAKPDVAKLITLFLLMMGALFLCLSGDVSTTKQAFDPNLILCDIVAAVVVAGSIPGGLDVREGFPHLVKP